MISYAQIHAVPPNGKIKVIAIIRSLLGLSLRDAKEICDAWVGAPDTQAGPLILGTTKLYWQIHEQLARLEGVVPTSISVNRPAGVVYTASETGIGYHWEASAELTVDLQATAMETIRTFLGEFHSDVTVGQIWQVLEALKKVS